MTSVSILSLCKYNQELNIVVIDNGISSNNKKIIEDISRLPSEKCINCQYIESCYGGCPVLWNNYSFDELNRYKERITTQ